MKGSIDEEPGIEWGGTDTDGTIEPQSQKLKRDFWGNENYWEQQFEPKLIRDKIKTDIVHTMSVLI